MKILSLTAGLVLGISLQAGVPRVGVSVLPLESMVGDLAGNQFQVRSLQQEGDSCSVFEPRPSAISWMSGAKLFFRTGTAYETVILDKFSQRFQNLKVVDLRDAVDLLYCSHDGHDHDHHSHHHGEAEDEGDPHIWLDPLRLVLMADFIALHLSEAFPEETAGFLARAVLFKERAAAVDARLAALLEPYAGRSFFIYHPALGYFADRYGLRQVSIASRGEAPPARELHQRIQQARREGVKAIFVQPQESRKQAAIIAQSVGAELIEIDPMGRQWDLNLIHLGEALAEAFSRE